VKVEAGLVGRTVVLTRPSVGTLADRLAATGATVEHVPLIAIGPPADGGDALRAALDDVAGFDWVVVTSSNGAAAVGDAVAGARGVRLAAVGPATARALEAQSGRPVDLVPADANSDGLLAAFPSAACRVLLAQADRAGEHLAAGLRAAGHDVVVVEAYATHPVAPTKAQLDILELADAVVLASGSAVEAWSQSAGEARGRRLSDVTAAIVTIGRRTADAAEAQGLEVAAVAGAPDDDAIVAAVVEALAVR
jgi:uroporphyrinogen-III synthase